MKYVKYFGVYILMFLLFLCTANAKKCSVYSGTGENIGDEIVCGTEHFYVIENDGTNVELMAKYNLYVGANWTKEILDNDKYPIKECTTIRCQEEISTQIKEDYGLYSITYILERPFDGYENKKLGYFPDMYHYGKSIYKIYIYEILGNQSDGYGKQNPLAVGVTGEKGNANYPIYATFPLDTAGSRETTTYSSKGEIYEDGYYDFELYDDTEVMHYLNRYKELLVNEGYEINKIDFPTMTKINELTYAIKGEYLPLKEWFHNAKLIEDGIKEDDELYELGSIKNILGEKYSWIWQTSYWTRTGIEHEEISYFTAFISTAGDMCSMPMNCTSIPRAGLRPIITMSSNQIESYKIETKSTNGKIEYTIENGKVVISLIPDEGYELSSLKAYDSKNNEIKIENNTFDILNDDVTIEAIFSKVESPNTSSFTNIKYLIFALILLSIITILIKKQKIISK